MREKERELRVVLHRLREGELTVEQAEAEICGFEDLGFGKVDYAREKRTGYPEVIFGQGKAPEHVRAIFSKLVERHGRAMVTRADQAMAAEVWESVPYAEFDPMARLITFGGGERRFGGVVAVVSAGTADVPVAEEAARTAEWMGSEVDRIYDVGVAGIDRLLAQRNRLQRASVVIVVAGMEGALSSVIGGLVRRPVIAVPTSVGYGAHFAGLTPLLSMLTSCAAGVTVVNIDNGFGAAYAASILQQAILEGASLEG
ncbi:nickel pincer cofactor biosynthesis protein LarB [Tumebacillus sp. ITR2]|uniref:Nickel pincer cofactor biosynthesis protein LarB n=1 Tax=Tumebacillus amylolyticus TaxID=2801339 RepID=A0ABS1JGS1_9BACL|nr:nickel pincer cofactor biosynthesis protein LarB [Tumebacillus amylolyticus]MBL0389492.1 nickel pincer cofactor biosynthesis protein LarB [Tumebacillus amylolyticus]